MNGCANASAWNGRDVYFTYTLTLRALVKGLKHGKQILRGFLHIGGGGKIKRAARAKSQGYWPSC